MTAHFIVASIYWNFPFYQSNGTIYLFNLVRPFILQHFFYASIPCLPALDHLFTVWCIACFVLSVEGHYQSTQTMTISQQHKVNFATNIPKTPYSGRDNFFSLENLPITRANNAHIYLIRSHIEI